MNCYFHYFSWCRIILVFVILWVEVFIHFQFLYFLYQFHRDDSIPIFTHDRCEKWIRISQSLFLVHFWLHIANSPFNVFQEISAAILKWWYLHFYSFHTKKKCLQHFYLFFCCWIGCLIHCALWYRSFTSARNRVEQTSQSRDQAKKKEQKPRTECENLMFNIQPCLLKCTFHLIPVCMCDAMQVCLKWPFLYLSKYNLNYAFDKSHCDFRISNLNE